MTAAALLVMAKAPVAGRVKTRLAPPLTPGQAAEVAAAALTDTLDAIGRTDAHHRRVLALDGDLGAAVRGIEIAERLTADRWWRLAQRGRTFAERLVAAHQDVARRYPGRPVVQIGMDTPQVTPTVLADAAARFDDPACDAVLGISEDGGWWLLGLRDARFAQVLDGVPMSTDRTGEETLKALRRQGCRVALTESLDDVDTWADALAVAAVAPGSRTADVVRRLARTVVGLEPDLGCAAASPAGVR